MEYTKEMIKHWLTQLLKPTEQPRRENQCGCGSNMLTFYSQGIKKCYMCNRTYNITDGVEIRHQR
jgi:hypothetical protein